MPPKLGEIRESKRKKEGGSQGRGTDKKGVFSVLKLHVAGERLQRVGKKKISSKKACAGAEIGSERQEGKS